MAGKQFCEQLAEDIEGLMQDYLATKADSMDEWYASERDNHERALEDFIEWVRNGA